MRQQQQQQQIERMNEMEDTKKLMFIWCPGQRAFITFL